MDFPGKNYRQSDIITFVTDFLEKSIDARQFPAWADFLKNIGWEIEKVGKNNIAVRQLPLLKRPIIKIQHPLNPFPFKKVDKIARKYKALFVLVEPHNYKYDENKFLSNGYKKNNMRIIHSATIKIDLRKTSRKLFESFSENARRNITKAKKNNLVIKKFFLKEKNGERYFDDFCNLLFELVKIKKFYLPPKSELIAKMKGFKNNSVLFFAYEKDREVPIAALWLGFYKNVSFYIQTGITKKGYELLANYLLVWEALQYSIKEKLEVFDFESIYDERYPGEHKDWKGYSEFKKRFHGQRILYPPSWIKIYNSYLKFLHFFL